MKVKFRLKDKWKSVSIYTKNCETIIRYWGKLKFDIVRLYSKSIIFGCLAIGLSSCCDEINQQKYSIHDANGTLYLTNEYKINGSCIEFKDCDCEEGRKMKLCGSYTIKELK